MNFKIFKTAHRFSSYLLVSTFLLLDAVTLQAALPLVATTMPAIWRSDSVVYVAGLTNLKPGSRGSLRITPAALIFSTVDIDSEISVDRVTAVSIGDERVPTGGTAGMIARKIPIYGIGPAMGAITNKKVDVLTVEYLDNASGYHGAVFELPKMQAAIAQQKLVGSLKVPEAVDVPACTGAARPYTLLLAPIAVSGVDLPPEYRVLLYEQLVEELKKANAADAIFRSGSASAGAGCTAMTLRLSVNGFKKGNEALRASTGAIGFFVGSTSVTFHVDVIDNQEHVLFAKSLKKSKHGDSDSLNLARDLARDVSKRLAKVRSNTQQARS